MSTNNTVLSDPQKASLTQDATNRANRTIWQGLGIDVIVAVALLVVNIFTDAQGWSDLDWKIIGFSLMKTVLMAVAAFVMRRFMDPSRIPTPLPTTQPQPVVTTDPLAGDDIPDGESTDSIISDTELNWPDDDPNGVVPQAQSRGLMNPSAARIPDGVDIPGGDDLAVDPPMDHDQVLDDRAGE